MAKLILESPRAGEPKDFSLPASGTVTLGRVQGADVFLDRLGVSRRHAQIDCRGDGYWLVDTESKQGTFVNDVPVTEAKKLTDGVEIRLSKTRLRFQDNGRSAPKPVRKVQVKPENARQEESNSTSSAPGPKDEGESGSIGLYSDEAIRVRKLARTKVLAKLNLREVDSDQTEDAELLDRLSLALDDSLLELTHEIPDGLPMPELRQSLLDDLVNLGPISSLIKDTTVTEVMVNGPDKVFVERDGRLEITGIRFLDSPHLLGTIRRIVERVGRHVDESSPKVDAHLADGSRVNAIIPPLAVDGPSLTIRKFPEKAMSVEQLIDFGSLTKDMADFLREAVRAKQNIVVSGGTGSGKTTLLNVMSQFIPGDERVVTIEDTAELRLSHQNLVRLQARPPNIEGEGEITIQTLVVNALRMRPDRIIVGECRKGEALDMLQAMNTGHDGSMTTIHANSPRDSMARTETMVMMAGYDLPSRAIRDQIASAMNLVVQQTRFVDGSRRIEMITEVTGREGDTILMSDLFKFKQEGFNSKGKVIGKHVATGNRPIFLQELEKKGDLNLNMDMFRSDDL